MLYMRFPIHSHVSLWAIITLWHYGLTHISMVTVHSLVSMVRFLRTLKCTLFKILNDFAIDLASTKSHLKK